MKKIEDEIIALSHRIVAIELAREADSLECLVCDDYIGIDPSGALIDKSVSVGRYRNPEFQLTKHGVSDITVKVIGESAIEIGVMKLKGKLGLFEFGGKYRYCHVWQKMEDGWRVKLSQLTPIIRDDLY